jgi:hypothetical protein
MLEPVVYGKRRQGTKKDKGERFKFSKRNKNASLKVLETTTVVARNLLRAGERQENLKELHVLEDRNWALVTTFPSPPPGCLTCVDAQ